MPLIVNKKEIHNISGPVSMYILKPKPNQQMFKNLPMYILFGDIHNNNDNLCDQKIDIGKTYNIYDIEFLSLFSKLSTPEEPIDFYTESQDLHNYNIYEPFDTIYPMDYISSLYSQCYSKRKLVTYEYDEQKCKEIENVRWHSADARQFSFHHQPLVVGCNYSAIARAVNHALNENDPKSIPELKNTIEEVIKNQIDTFGSECLSMLSKNNPFLQEYKNILKKEMSSSVIGKQIREFKKSNIETYKYLIDCMNTYIDYQYNIYFDDMINQDGKLWLYQTHSRLMNIIKNILDPSVNKITAGLAYEKIFQFFNEDLMTYYVREIVSKESVILDLYSFFRSLKYTKNILPTKKDPLPIINIFYLGNLHVKNMVHLLTNITGMYDFVYTHPHLEEKDIRCIKIIKEIDLDNTIMDLRRERNVVQN